MINHIITKTNPIHKFLISLISIVLCVFVLSIFYGDIINSIRLNERMSIYLPYNKHLELINNETNETLYLDKNTVFITRLKIDETKLTTETIPKNSFIVYGSNKVFLITIILDNQIPKTTN